MAVKTVTKKSTKKKIVSADKGGNDDDESTEDEMKVIPIPEKSDVDGNGPSAARGAKAKPSGSQSLTLAALGDCAWTDEQLLSELQHIDQGTSANIIRLFNDDNTIPFMCRYRRELIGDLSPDQ